MQSNDYNVCLGHKHSQRSHLFNNSKMNLDKINAINQKITNINIILNPKLWRMNLNFGALDTKLISLNATLWTPKTAFLIFSNQNIFVALLWLPKTMSAWV